MDSGIKITYIKTSELYKAEWNYKDDDEEMARKLTENIKRNGILQVSVVYEEEDGRKVVLDGNHRLDSYYTLCIDEVPCVNLGKIKRTEAQRISIELNETKFENDMLKLSKVMQDINREFDVEDMAKTLGFSKDEIEAFVAIDGIEFPDAPDGPGEVGDLDEEDETECECPECGFVFPRSEGLEEV